MLVLYEGVAPGLGVLRGHHHADALHSAVLLELPLQLALTDMINLSGQVLSSEFNRK